MAFIANIHKYIVKYSKKKLHNLTDITFPYQKEDSAVSIPGVDNLKIK